MAGRREPPGSTRSGYHQLRTPFRGPFHFRQQYPSASRRLADAHRPLGSLSLGVVQQATPSRAQAMSSKRPRDRSRSGKVLVCTVVLLPALIGMLALVIDGSLLLAEARHLQHVADAAALAAAREL